ncbi:MAG: hypothetical protein VX949_01665 [Planctomycetota bacterium]|nr:hypothetical protein [Planctomycetota bacterium]
MENTSAQAMVMASEKQHEFRQITPPRQRPTVAKRPRPRKGGASMSA